MCGKLLMRRNYKQRVNEELPGNGDAYWTQKLGGLIESLADWWSSKMVHVGKTLNTKPTDTWDTWWMQRTNTF